MQDVTDPRDWTADKIRFYRRQRKMTLRALAARSGIPLSTLSDYESGQSSPSFARQAAIARGLGIPMAALYSLDPPPGREHGLTG